VLRTVIPTHAARLRRVPRRPACAANLRHLSCVLHAPHPLSTWIHHLHCVSIRLSKLLSRFVPPMGSAQAIFAPLCGIELCDGGDLRMFHAFQMYVASGCCAKIDLVLHMLKWIYMYVTCICFKCFGCFRQTLQCVLSGYCKSRSGVHMLQWLYMYIVSVCFKCFSYFRRMLQMFYLDVAYVEVAIHICCNHMFQVFQLFSDVCYSKCFMLQVLSLAGTGSELRRRRSSHPRGKRSECEQSL
jgi:hypothetical protein